MQKIRTLWNMIRGKGEEEEGNPEEPAIDPSIPRDVVFCANRMTTAEFEAVGFKKKAEELRKNFKFVREMPPSKQKDKLLRWWQKEHLNVFNEVMATEFSDPLPKKFRKHAVK